MAGIYIHIPFCKKACHYCNFHFSTSLQYKDEIIDAIVQEIVLQKNYLKEPIETIYFGGGSPSIVDINDVEKILNTIVHHFSLNPSAEITLECNPDDIDKEKIIGWRKLGINRLSIGVQSFLNKDLLWMNRVHNGLEAIHCIQISKENGIDNLNIDLIYGIPGLRDEEWLQNLEKARQLNIQHLSCYALTVEPKTALETMIQQNKKEPVDPDKAAHQFELLMNWALEKKFEHYEISNFAKIGYRSKHNTAYWQGSHYLGIGPSAHSYNGSSRQWNIAHNALYVQSIKKNMVPFEIEVLSEKEKINETIMTSLRTIEGLDVRNVAGLDIINKAKKFIDTDMIVLESGFLKLTNKGKLRADGIAAELFE